MNLLLIAAAASLLFADYNSSLSAAGNEQIGTITFKKKVAERKYSEQVIWEQLKQNSPLYNFDSIRTEPGSLAVINLNNGTTIEIAEESMIILKESKEGIDINFEKGSISAKGAGGSSKQLSISSGDAKIALGDAALSVKKEGSDTGSDMQVNVESGSAKITAGGKTSAIDSTQQATISGNEAKIAKVNLRLTAPANSKYFVSNASVPVSFQWQSDSGGDAKLQVSSSSSFGSMVYNATAASGQNVELEGGTWYWRVVKDGETSQVRVLSVISERPPVLVRPSPGQQFGFTAKNPLVSFKWSGAESASSFKLEVSQNSSFTAVVKSFSTSESSIATDALGEGTYYCRVTGSYRLPDGERTLSSGTAEFTIKKSLSLAAPDLLSPARGQNLSQLAPATVFNWKQIYEAKQYVIRVYRDGAAVVDTVVTTNYYKHPDPLPQGSYRWTVVAQSEDGSQSTGNKESEFKISGSEMLATTSPSIGSSFSTSQSVDLSWRDPNNGNKYLVELSRDSGFSNIEITREVTSHSLSLGTLSRGSWYWKVYLIDAEGRRLITSNVSSFNITGTLENPRPVFPTASDTFPRNAPDIVFRWQPVSDATHYQIMIFRSSLPRSAALQTLETAGSSFTYSPKNFTPGRYEWEVRAVIRDGERVVTQSGISKESFTIKEREKLPSPKLISPTTIYIEKE